MRNIGGTDTGGQSVGIYALVLDAVNPPGAYWSVFFKVTGNPLNWSRTEYQSDGSPPPQMERRSDSNT